jgi:hypothetical protein
MSHGKFKRSSKMQKMLMQKHLGLIKNTDDVGLIFFSRILPVTENASFITGYWE